MQTTPAPWYVESPSFNGRLHVIGRNDVHVCTVEAHFTSDLRYNEGNAHLISSAPAMRKALESIRDYQGRFGEDDPVSIATDILALMDSVTSAS